MTTRDKIHELVTEYIQQKGDDFKPGKTPVLTGFALYDEKELNAIIDSILDGWFGLGAKGLEFESKFADILGIKHSIMVNSGSSANLIALNAIKNANKLKSGEIITPACTFPTTLNPIIQLGFRPAFLDVDKTLNPNPNSLHKAINDKTKGIMLAHTLGNPAQIKEIREIANENDLFIIEDCCDALGSRYEGKTCGTFGDVSTFSFYPAHIITTGEGGALSTNNSVLNRTIRSLRDWGRDCWCTTDEKNLFGACGKRFDFKIKGTYYDHKYIYSQIGYNMKPLELQAAMGVEQLGKLEKFIEIRKRNFKIYSEEMSKFEDYIELPAIYEKADPVFFGLPLIIKDKRIRRQNLIKFLNDRKIGTRLLFAGNILHQPAYKNIFHSKYEDLTYSDKLTKDCFWIGLHPGINEEMIKYVISQFSEYFGNL